MISPGTESPEAQLSRLWQEAREYERRTFSNVAVTNGAATLLEVRPLPDDPGKSLVAIRDGFNHDLLKNDINSGWGLAAPQNGYPSYPAWPAAQTAATSFTELWLYVGFTYSKLVEWGYIHGTEFADTFSECQMEWSPNVGPPWTAIPGSTTQSNEDVSAASTVFTVRSGTFELPITAAGNTFSVRLVCRKASGTGLKAFCSPVYLNVL